MRSCVQRDCSTRRHVPGSRHRRSPPGTACCVAAPVSRALPRRTCTFPPSSLGSIGRYMPPGFANPGVAPVDRSVSSAARTRWALLPHPASTLSVCHFWLNSNSEVRRSMFACSHIRIRIHCTACELSRVHLQISYPAINSLIPILRLPVVPCLTNCRRLP
jgi:hypothetical protein